MTVRASPADFPWQILLRRIAAGECTPFLGAGVSHPPLPDGAQLAAELADEFDYPFTDRRNLATVAQYVATKENDSVFPKEEICRRFAAAPPPDFDDIYEPHAVLAELPLPLYLTTNYDDYMSLALERRQRHVTREICRWSSGLRRKFPSYLAKNVPTPEQPVVFHIHGHVGTPSSMVLTEVDYYDHTIDISAASEDTQPEDMVLPPRVQEALAATSLLFVGYSLQDWNLRLLLRALIARAESTQRRLSVSVQLEPKEGVVRPDRLGEAQEFLDKYFDQLQVRVYWGPASDFAGELRDRWAKFSGG